MKAVYIKKYGGLEVLQYGDFPIPNINDPELLIKVYASSVNPVDWKIRKGYLRIIPGVKLPIILGCDIAGIVEKVGRDVKDFKVGEQIYGLINASNGGGYAEYALATTDQISLKPKNINFNDAAAIPLAALTAYQSLKRLGNLKAGDSVVVNGCTGGVGHFAVQIAKALGAKVTGICSARNINFAKELGVDIVSNYSEESILETKERYDIFFDAVASQSFRKVRKILKKNGIYITTLPAFNYFFGKIFEFFNSKKSKIIMVKSKQDDLRFLSEMVKSGKLNPVVDKIYKLEDVAEAHRYSETGRVVGKLSISIRQEL